MSTPDLSPVPKFRNGREPSESRAPGPQAICGTTSHRATYRWRWSDCCNGPAPRAEAEFFAIPPLDFFGTGLAPAASPKQDSSSMPMAMRSGPHVHGAPKRDDLVMFWLVPLIVCGPGSRIRPFSSHDGLRAERVVYHLREAPT
jgi:hypothetical protein